MIDFAASLIVWLRPQLTDAGVGAKHPGPHPGRHVLVRRLGGTWQPPVIDNVTVGLEAWAPTAAQAHDLIQEARALVHSLEGGLLNGTAIYRVEEFAGPAWFPDPDSEEPRYTITLNIRHREHLEVSA